MGQILTSSRSSGSSVGGSFFSSGFRTVHGAALYEGNTVQDNVVQEAANNQTRKSSEEESLAKKP